MIQPAFEILNQRGTPMFFSDIFANRPTAGIVGRIFISTDTKVFYRDTGTTWEELSGQSFSGSLATGQVAFGSATNTIAGSNNLFWDNTNGNLQIGSITPLTSGGKLQVSGDAQIRNVRTHALGSILTGFQSYTTYTIPASQSFTSGLFYGAANNSFESIFQGSNTLPNTITFGGIRANASIGFTANSTITVSQGSGGTLRSISNLIAQYVIPTNGAGSTIEYASGIHIYAPILSGTTPTFANYFGLAINDSTEYSPTITNRWGIYQAGSSDKNYFASSVLIGQNIDLGYKLYVNGTIGTDNSITIGAGGTGYSRLRAISGADLVFNACCDRMIIRQTGNVGIGTLTPAYKLDIYGGASGTRTDVFVNNAAANYNIGVLSDNNGFASTTNAMIFYTNANERMRMTSGGNLLVGTTTDSGERLYLNGSLRIDGQLSATAGGNSGQHLIINCDGTTYKIALLNP